MIRVSEMVLAGHPDKFCDQIADAVVGAAMQFEPEAYAQIEVAAWCDDIWLNGGIATTRKLPFSLDDVVQQVARRVGYRDRDGAPRKFRVHSETVCLDVIDPTRWSRHVNDQAIVVGYGGYDERTSYLPPEHFAAHWFRQALEVACGSMECGRPVRSDGRPAPDAGSEDGGRPRPPVTGVEPVTAHGAPGSADVPAAAAGVPRPTLIPRNSKEPEELRGTGRAEAPRGTGGRGLGPDGKLLLRTREDGDEWRIEHLLVTIQQSEDMKFLDVVEQVTQVLREAYDALRAHDPRWCAEWDDVELLLNPNGPLVSGGSDGDNGQTGRKLVMDYYGPRVAIGGGALSGKHLTHIDRLAAYAAREAAIEAIKGARASAGVSEPAPECRIVLAYAPNLAAPLDVVYELSQPGPRKPPAFFDHDAMRERYAAARITGTMPTGDHFLNAAYPWNG